MLRPSRPHVHCFARVFGELERDRRRTRHTRRGQAHRDPPGDRAAGRRAATRRSPRTWPATRRSSARSRRAAGAGGRLGPAPRASQSGPCRRSVHPAAGRSSRRCRRAGPVSGRPLDSQRAVVADPRRARCGRVESGCARQQRDPGDRAVPEELLERVPTAPAERLEQRHVAELRPVDPGGIAPAGRPSSRPRCSGRRDHRAGRGGAGREQGQAEHHGRTEPRASRAEHGDEPSSTRRRPPPPRTRPLACPACRSASRRRTGSASR